MAKGETIIYFRTQINTVVHFHTLIYELMLIVSCTSPAITPRKVPFIPRPSTSILWVYRGGAFSSLTPLSLGRYSLGLAAGKLSKALARVLQVV